MTIMSRRVFSSVSLSAAITVISVTPAVWPLTRPKLR